MPTTEFENCREASLIRYPMVLRKYGLFRAPNAENLNFEKRPFKVSGLVGNALSYDDYVIIIDLPRNRMAILQSR